MKFIADLHIHSKYSRATSKDLNFEQLYLWAQLKGIHVVGTGDFTHPAWMKEFKEKLEPAEEGFFQIKKQYAKTMDRQVPASCAQPVRFIFSAEISSIYKKAGRVRKIHNILFAPDVQTAEKIQSQLGRIGNISSDGRPILGLDAHDLLEITLQAHPKAFLVPAHIWTPWFSLLGSKGGFDSIKECFGDLTQHVFALETGLSSDPEMNWRLSQLDTCVLISNSDAHSASKLGREANIFDTDFSYTGIYNALKNPENNGFLGTVEFFPEEGKYHYDGHRECETRLTPQETKRSKGLCPECGKPVTVGVMSRVEELADRKQGEKGPRAKPYHSLIPLVEVIAEAKGKGVNSKAVQDVFRHLLQKIGSEMDILQNTPIKDIQAIAGELIAEGIHRMRRGVVQIAPGYDGEYGKVKLFSPKERQELVKQMTLF